MRTPQQILELLKSLNSDDKMAFYMAVAEVTDEEALAIAMLPPEEANEFRALLGIPGKADE